MRTTSSHPKTHHEDSKFKEQRRKVFQAFSEQPLTMLMAEVKTGVMRSNICWFVSVWEDMGSIIRLPKAKCKISKYYAHYFTTCSELTNKAEVSHGS